MAKEHSVTELRVKIAFDPKAKVWVTWDSQVPGLIAIDDTKNGLIDQIEHVSPDLMEWNRESTLLTHDKKYEIVVFEQKPPVMIEKHGNRRALRVKSFSVEQHSSS